MPAHHQVASNLDVLQHRAQLMKRIREFMAQRNILEVDTPVLNSAGVTDPNIGNLITEPGQLDRGAIMYLGTSPEFYMKRLLAEGCGPIYQLCKVFRDDPAARLHQPEFTMLEWYRPGFDHMELMGEIDELLYCLGIPGSEKYEYRETFLSQLQIDPFTCSIEELSGCALASGFNDDSAGRDILLDYLFSHRVIPGLGTDKPFFIYHYPASQAALAKISNSTPAYAERFELFYRGMELANGFHELTDAAEQRERFEKENRERVSRGEAEITIDQLLLEALEKGLPACAGVAVGVDRLLMTMLDKQHIKDVMSFPIVQE